MKIEQYINDMQEQSYELTYSEFVLKFGEYFSHIWVDYNDEKLLEIVDWIYSSCQNALLKLRKWCVISTFQKWL